MTITRPIADDYDPYRIDNRSIGRDESQDGIGNPRIHIDLGKSVSAISLCAAICGICAAVTVLTVWHSKDFEVQTIQKIEDQSKDIDKKNKEREVETQAQIRILKNHIDDAYNRLAIIEGKRHD